MIIQQAHSDHTIHKCGTDFAWALVKNDLLKPWAFLFISLHIFFLTFRTRASLSALSAAKQAMQTASPTFDFDKHRYSLSDFCDSRRGKSNSK